MNSDTYVIIPVYNEAAVIRKVLQGVLADFTNVVCVDDGSHDQSAQEIKETKATLVSHPINLGQGAALQTGLEYALRDPRAQYFVTFDADGQHRVSDAVRILAEARKGEYDIILGSRFLDDSSAVPRMKRMILIAGTRFGNIISGTRLTDTHNGLRVSNRRFVEQLDITMPDMTHGTELTIIIGRSGLRYKEMPVTIDYTEYSKSKGQSVWNSINILVELFVQYILGGKN